MWKQNEVEGRLKGRKRQWSRRTDENRKKGKVGESKEEKRKGRHARAEDKGEEGRGRDG